MKRQKLPLVLEQLEDRIFLDANPLVVIDGVHDHAEEPTAEVPVEVIAEPIAEPVAAEPGNTEHHVENPEGDSAVSEEHAGSVDDAQNQNSEESEQNDPVVEQGSVIASEDSNNAGTQNTEIVLPNASDTEVTGDTLVSAETSGAVDDIGDAIQQVVFVDSSVADHETLLDGIVEDISAGNSDSIDSNAQSYNGIKVVTLDASQDEFQQITDALSNFTNLDGVHIISHGANSSLRLGNATLDSGNLDDYAGQLNQWGEALAADGDLLLYGCNVAGDGTGVEFIEAVSGLTGADVAASDDATGNSSSGGDWDLEVATGDIDVHVITDASGEWTGLLAPPDPIAGGSATDTQPMLNSEIGFSVTFDNDVNNDDADEGYWPYVDIVVPSSVDVQGGPTVFGSPATYQTFTWNGNSWDGASEHPYNSHGSALPMPTGTNVGDTWYLVDLPFGSFVRDQPVASIDFTADISTAGGAVAGTDIDIVSTAGFRYGDTATNDHGPIEEGTTHVTTITPRVLDIEKINDAPESQTVTGPNYPVEYTLTVNVANGETVNDVTVSDYLPENAVYRGDITVTPINGAAPIAATTIHEPTEFTVLGATAADRLLEVNLGNITGVNNSASGISEYQVTYTVYFSNVDASGNPLLNPVTGDDDNVMNESSVAGDYNGGTVTDGTDTPLGALNDDASDSITPSDNQIEIDSIVTYKSAAKLDGGGIETLPGDVVVWTMEVDVSDYFGVGNVVLNDTFGDGQTFIDGVNAAHADQLVPTLEVWENGVHTGSTSFDAANYTVGAESALNDAGDTSLQFRVSDQLVTMGQDAFLDGGFFADGSADGAQHTGDALNTRLAGDATRLFVVFRTVVDQNYDKLQNTAGHSGDPSIDVGDTIANHVEVVADIEDNAIDHNTVGTEADLSSAITTVPGGSVLKEIYAVNGNTAYDVSQGVTSGDRITYHLRMDLPTADFEKLVINDFLPLPAYDASEISSNTGNDFDGTINFTGGEVEFGGAHNLNSDDIPGLQHNDSGVDVGSNPIAPTLTIDADNNSMSLDFGSYDTDDPTADGMSATIDVLVTVTIQNNPMADELLLTNQGEWTLNDTNLSPDAQVDIIPIKLNEPEVHIIKGVVNTDGNGTLGAAQGPGDLTFNADGSITVAAGQVVESQELADNPVDADLINADGSDLVTFAITIYNTGGANAYDINVTDTMPTGFVEPAAGVNLRVYNGTGSLLTEGAGNDYTIVGGDFFANGEINFHDEALTGDSTSRGAGGGTDVFIITYQLQVDNETAVDADVVEAGSSHENTASIDFFTGKDDDATDWTDRLGEPTDNASVTISSPHVEKHFLSTEIVNGTNTNDQAVIGEEVTYQITITVPEGATPAATLVDSLDSGLTFVALTNVTATGDLVTSNGNGVINTTNITASTAGQNINFDLGTITNTNNDDGVDDQITLTYTVFVNNSAGNQNGAGNVGGQATALDNSAIVNFTGGHSNTDDAEDVTVIEPDLEVLKTVEVGGDGDATGDAGDTVEYNITIQHSAASETEAFDVTFSDTIPAQVEGLSITQVTDTDGILVAGDFTLAGNDLSLTGNIDIPEGRVITITVSGTLAAGVTPGQSIANTAGVQWQSLDAPHHQNDLNERTGSGVGNNNYSDDGSATLTVNELTVDKTLVGTEINDPGVNENNEAIIGELATYQVVVDVPEGHMDNARLVDTLGAGLAFGHLTSVSVTAGDLTSSVPLTVAGITTSTSGQATTFNLGNLVNGADNNGIEQITLQYTVLVTNESSNSDGVTLHNTAQVLFDGGSSAVDSAPDITVIEPQISTIKSVADSSDAGTDASWGEEITYTARFTNSGHATAYEVNALDTLAAGTEFVGLATVHDQALTDLSGSTTITDNGDGTISIAGDWDIAEGDWVEVTYTVKVTEAVFMAAPHTNTIDADWSSNDNTNSLTSSGIDRLYEDGATPYTVDGNQDEATAQFTVLTNSSIGDLVFFDKDQSGDLSAGDTGITGIGVTLTADVDGDGTVDYTWHTTTAADGTYHFNNLPSFDNYTVTVDPANLPPNTDQSYDLDGLTPEHVTAGITLGVSEDRTDVDFGYITAGTGAIGDTVWYDANNDGVQDASELGLAGVELTLTGDITGDGAPDVTFTTTTDANGQYLFDELLAGDYTVTVTDRPAGMEQTFDLDDGTAPFATPDAASIALADGEQNNNVDFGYTGAANIGDTIYFDADNSDSETAGDVGLGGVTVTLTGDVNNDGIEDVLTTTTDANGNYLFENLRDGDYVVTVDPAALPGGMNQTADPDGVLDNTSDVTLAGGADDLDQDFGYTGTGTIGDRIWNDLDGDGIQDAGEGGINGVDVTLSVDFDGDGVVDYTETVSTAGDGDYSFTNLPAGSYTIAVDTSSPALATSILTGDPDSSLDSTSTVNLPAGGTNLDQDFGYHDTGAATGSIGDTIFFDQDHSGSETAGDTGLSGVTVTLTGDIDGDGDVDTLTTTTDANGTYLFDNLVAGNYTVAVDPSTLPAGMTQTADPDGGNDNTADVNLAAGEDNDLQDFGYDGTGSIGDTIYFDGNNNGSQDGGEGGIDNVQVRLDLDLDGDGVVDHTETTTTAADGSYLFENLPAGDYTITVDPATLPAGMQQSADPDVSLDNTSSLTLTGGQNNLDQDFGYIGTGSIGDTIWNDVDGDGAQNGGETGIANVDVTLTADIDGDGNPDYTTTVTTDANGNYVFENLPAGDYTINVNPASLPAGMDPVSDPDGGNDNTADVTLVAGEDNLGQDFGYNSGTGSIGDTIYFDADNSGTETAGDVGLAGITITLTGDVNGDGTIDTVTAVTDSNGNYLFENLAAGNYTVTVDQSSLPAGMNQTADPDGVLDNTSNVNLAPGAADLGQDFGYTGSGTIGDRIWNDLNGDGVQDAGEGGINGVDVTLSVDFDGDGVVDYTETVATAGDGGYSFTNLPAGSYTIAVDTNDPTLANSILTGDPDSNPDSTSTVNLPAGGTNLDQDFGYHDTGAATGSIGDTIWFDSNGDGLQNDGPTSGLGGVTVTLTGDIDGDGDIDTVTTVTDGNGAYLFDNLVAGDFTVTVDPAGLPGGMIQTGDPDGGNDNTANVTIGGANPLDNVAQDFGYTGTGVIGDTIYFDTDGDGTQDSGENGMPGVDVTISVDLDGDGTPDYTATATTDPNGNYSFDHLPAGDYTITVDPATLPGDVVASGDPDGTPDNSTVLTLGPGEINNDQDFGYTGSGFIGDTIYFDADGNGFQSSGELGLSGVTVTLQGDFDNDGIIDSVTTVTDANGQYLFDGLIAGNYTVYVDSTTLPSGLTQTGDPDATLDDQSSVTLLAGENNVDQDFGYGGISPFINPVVPDVPVEPIIPGPPPSPVVPHSAAVPQEQGLTADAFLMHRQFGDQTEDDTFFYPFGETPWLEPMVPVSPLYTGHAEPGTTLEFVLYDALGNQIAYRSIMADTAGDWLVSFPGTIMFDLPHHMEIQQTASTYNASTAGFFNMRVFYNPNFSSMVFSSAALDVETVFAYLPSTVMESVHMGNLSPFNLEWDDFDGYEFIAPSIHPANSGH